MTPKAVDLAKRREVRDELVRRLDAEKGAVRPMTLNDLEAALEGEGSEGEGEGLGDGGGSVPTGGGPD